MSELKVGDQVKTSIKFSLVYNFNDHIHSMREGNVFTLLWMGWEEGNLKAGLRWIGPKGHPSLPPDMETIQLPPSLTSGLGDHTPPFPQTGLPYPSLKSARQEGLMEATNRLFWNNQQGQDGGCGRYASCWKDFFILVEIEFFDKEELTTS